MIKTALLAMALIGCSLISANLNAINFSDVVCEWNEQKNILELYNNNGEFIREYIPDRLIEKALNSPLNGYNRETNTYFTDQNKLKKQTELIEIAIKHGGRLNRNYNYPFDLEAIWTHKDFLLDQLGLENFFKKVLSPASIKTYDNNIEAYIIDPERAQKQDILIDDCIDKGAQLTLAHLSHFSIEEVYTHRELLLKHLGPNVLLGIVWDLNVENYNHKTGKYHINRHKMGMKKDVVELCISNGATITEHI